MLWKSAGDQYTIISNYFIRYYRKLGLSHGEKNLIEIILTFKHTSEHPFPAVETLADLFYGKDTKTARRNVRAKLRDLQERGYLKIVERRGKDNGHLSNAYNLNPLIESLSSLAAGMEKERGAVENEQGGAVRNEQPGAVENEPPGAVRNEQPKKNLEKETYKNKYEKDQSISPNKVREYTGFGFSSYNQRKEREKKRKIDRQNVLPMDEQKRQERQNFLKQQEEQLKAQGFQ